MSENPLTTVDGRQKMLPDPPVLMKVVIFLFILLLCHLSGRCQHEHAGHETKNLSVSGSDLQPVFGGFRALLDAFKLTGMSLTKEDSVQVEKNLRGTGTMPAMQSIAAILDKYCLISVTINPEARVSVSDGAAEKTATQNQWKAFLVKVVNDAGITSALHITSVNALLPYHSPSWLPRVDSNDIISAPESDNRFLRMELSGQKPMLTHLSGARLEYQILKMYFSRIGNKEISVAADAGEGTADLAFRNSTRLQFCIRKAVRIRLSITDGRNEPGMASLTITRVGQMENNLAAYYPLPAARVAANDEYPDFFFQPQIYRQDGEELFLAPGRYLVQSRAGPESVFRQDTLNVPEEADSLVFRTKLQAWFSPGAYHYFSSDHHVHAAGCSHYDSPEEGVNPRDMWRQQVGEDLNISANLAWGPSWYHQKTFFTGRDEPYSTQQHILHNDVEVSGFPSSHCGHLVLLGLKEDDYPGTTLIEQWPSWTAPVLQWAKDQGAVVGYAHSGWGLEPVNRTDSIFNYKLPKMDGIGADEFVATVTQHLVDFYSIGDTPPQWELNMLYHTWNCGFRTKLSGETDFPCITDDRVGQGRSYFKSASAKLTYGEWLKAIRAGTLYAGDGRSHILDFSVNGSERDLLSIRGDSTVIHISARVAALLSAKQSVTERSVAASPVDERPFWSIERARIGQSRKIKVECVMNGICVDSVFIEADGSLRQISFSVPLRKSAWVALRIFPSSHTNAIFVDLNDKEVREKQSAEWCIGALKKCWKEKSVQIRPDELQAAGTLYKKAQAVYESLLTDK